MKQALLLLVFILIGFKGSTQDSLVVHKKGAKLMEVGETILPLEIKKPYPFARFTAKDSLLFQLDSLVRPFYSVKMDSRKNELSYRRKYRLKVDPRSGDSTYISLPKAVDFISIAPILEIDTLEVAPITAVAIDTLKKAADPVWWAYKNSFAFDISEAAFVNWNAGGNNSISGLLKLSFEREYKKLYVLWKNEVKVRYGLNSQEDQELRKTDDELFINSTFGYRTDTISNWYYSCLLYTSDAADD